MKESTTYYLYGAGKAVKKLRLGTLVYRDYANPTTTRHHTFEDLSDDELLKLSDADSLGHCAVTKKSDSHCGVKIEVAEVGGLDLSWTGKDETTLIAKKGERIELHHSDSFFAQHVLAESSTSRKALLTWLSASTSKAFFSKYGFVPAKIWLLTGIYCFSDVTAGVIQSNKTNAKINIDSAVIATLTGIPLGGYVGLGQESSFKIDSHWKGTLVWAAQWQRVDARFLEAEAAAALLKQGEVKMRLFPAIFSKGQLRNSDEPETLTAAVSLGESVDEAADSTSEPQRDQELDQAVDVYEEYYLGDEGED